MIELEFEGEYVVGAYGTAYRAIEVFRTGEMQGTHNERLRIINLLEADMCPDWTIDCCDGACSAYNDAINLIKGEQK